MRIYPTIILCALSCALTTLADARVGESRSEMETRLMRNRRVIEYPGRYLQKKLNNRQVPYRQYAEYFAPGVTHALYFKRATDVTVGRSDLDEGEYPAGWDLHVVYFNNISVFEAYRRNGAQLSDAEVNALLVMNQGSSFWKQVVRKEQPQLWGCDYVLEDDSMMAVRQGNFLIFYRPEFEKIARDNYQETREKLRDEQEQKAPISVQGF